MVDTTLWRYARNCQRLTNQASKAEEAVAEGAAVGEEAAVAEGEAAGEEEAVAEGAAAEDGADKRDLGTVMVTVMDLIVTDLISFTKVPMVVEEMAIQSFRKFCYIADIDSC